MEILPGELAVRATYGEPQPWCPTLGRGAPLAAPRDHGTNRRAVRLLDSDHKESAHAYLLLDQGRKGGLKLNGSLAGFL